MRLHGKKAIEYAAMSGGTVMKHSDPEEGEREVEVVEAESICAVDPSLIFVDVPAEDASALSAPPSF